MRGSLITGRKRRHGKKLLPLYFYIQAVFLRLKLEMSIYNMALKWYINYVAAFTLY